MEGTSAETRSGERFTKNMHCNHKRAGGGGPSSCVSYQILTDTMLFLIAIFSLATCQTPVPQAVLFNLLNTSLTAQKLHFTKTTENTLGAVSDSSSLMLDSCSFGVSAPSASSLFYSAGSVLMKNVSLVFAPGTPRLFKNFVCSTYSESDVYLEGSSLSNFKMQLGCTLVCLGSARVESVSTCYFYNVTTTDNVLAFIPPTRTHKKLQSNAEEEEALIGYIIFQPPHVIGSPTTLLAVCC